MAFDFGAALSAIGQVAPAMSEGAEIRRQRAADAAAVQQQAQAATDAHQRSLGQVQRERAITQYEQQQAAAQKQRAERLVPLSKGPQRGADGKYYMLFAGPDGRPQRLPVEGDYDPNLEKMRTLDELGIPRDSEMAKNFMLGIKAPVQGQPVLKQDENGNLNWFTKPTGTKPGAVIPTGAKGKTAASGSTTTTRTGQHFYIDRDNNMRELPYTTTTTTRKGGGGGGAAPSGGGGKAQSQVDPAGKVIGPAKLSNQERATVQTDEQITGFANEVLPKIEQAGMQGNNDSMRGLQAWAEYKAGRIPSDPFYASIMPSVAAIGIAGAAPWVRIGRNKYTFDVIQQHLPQPWQTPARIYANTKWLRDNVIPSSKESILGPMQARDTVNSMARSGQSKPKEDDVIVVSPEDLKR